jgi:hypothetical protein
MESYQAVQARLAGWSGGTVPHFCPILADVGISITPQQIMTTYSALFARFSP